MKTIVVHNLKETQTLAKKFSKMFVGGEIVLLDGDLGAGKTTFTKFVLKNLGVKGDVSSPTFSIMREYKTKKFNIFHFDMYRLSSAEEAREIGLEDYIFSSDKGSIVFIEWPENIKNMLTGEFINVKISNIDENSRKFEISRGGYNESFGC